MLDHIPFDRILFLDIETVPAYRSYSDVPDNVVELWDHKAKRLVDEGQVPADVYSKAGIFAEFGRIICISTGIIRRIEGGHQFRVKSFAGHDEKTLLNEFSNLLRSHFNKKDDLLCAHNGKEFDFPYLCRRLLINGMALPKILNIAGKKPWEVQHLDTMELWKFGDYKHYTPLTLLTQVFGIPSPKTDISGADVHRVYWEDNDLDRIVEYCERDVLALAQLLLKWRGEKLIEEGEIVVT
ncbi:MAG: 3'-5' exonuclease [Bacteroidia bacterium]|nr:3'-5' exonuclease [Bacteroidia bacterium]